MDGFDWVTALGSCALSVVFEKLKLDVQEDVRIRNAKLEEDKTHYSFKVISNSAGFVVATVAEAISRRIVQFTLTDTAIEASDAEDKKLLSATLTLDDKGDCRFLVGAEPKESWQLRKMALEQLLFTNPWKRN